MALDPKRILKPARKLRKLLKKMPSRPSAEDVHDFRTNSRRLEATLQALSLDTLRNGRRILKQISKLRKRAGKVRDMDVLTSYVSKVTSPDTENHCSVQLLKHLGAERQKHAKKLHASQLQYAAKLRKRLKQTFTKVEKAIPRNGASYSHRTTFSEDMAAASLKLLSQLAHPVRLNKANLHPYRLKVKELRNLLQMAEHAGDQKFVKRLGEVKDAIGEWHDWQELVAIANSVLDHGRECTMIRELRKIGDAKYRNALALSQAMRRDFLQLSNHKSKHASARQAGVPAAPVWTATYALTS